MNMIDFSSNNVANVVFEEGVCIQCGCKLTGSESVNACEECVEDAFGALADYKTNKHDVLFLG